MKTTNTSTHTASEEWVKACIPAALLQSSGPNPTLRALQAQRGRNIQIQDKPHSVPRKGQLTSNQEFGHHVKHRMKWEPCEHAMAMDSSAQCWKGACTSEVPARHEYRPDPKLLRSHVTSPMMPSGEVLQAHSNTDVIVEAQNKTPTSLPAKGKKKKYWLQYLGAAVCHCRSHLRHQDICPAHPKQKTKYILGVKSWAPKKAWQFCIHR